MSSIRQRCDAIIEILKNTEQLGKSNISIRAKVAETQEALNVCLLQLGIRYKPLVPIEPNKSKAQEKWNIKKESAFDEKIVERDMPEEPTEHYAETLRQQIERNEDLDSLKQQIKDTKTIIESMNISKNKELEEKDCEISTNKTLYGILQKNYKSLKEDYEKNTQ